MAASFVLPAGPAARPAGGNLAERPVPPGLQRVASSTVTVNGAVSATTGDEFIAGSSMNPPNDASAASTYCGDTGGFNNTHLTTNNPTSTWLI